MPETAVQSILSLMLVGGLHAEHPGGHAAKEQPNHQGSSGIN